MTDGDPIPCEGCGRTIAVVLANPIDGRPQVYIPRGVYKQERPVGDGEKVRYVATERARRQVQDGAKPGDERKPYMALPGRPVEVKCPFCGAVWGRGSI